MAIFVRILILRTGSFGELVNDGAKKIERVGQILTVVIRTPAADINEAGEGLRGGQHREALLVITEIE